MDTKIDYVLKVLAVFIENGETLTGSHGSKAYMSYMKMIVVGSIFVSQKNPSYSIDLLMH